VSNPKPSALGRLLDRQQTPAQRERLLQLRDELALADHDALWSLLELVEDYCFTLLQRHGARTASSSAKPWRLLALALGALVLLLAVAMYVGARTASGGSAIAWAGSGQGPVPQGLLATILGAPAGWLAFVCALPALAHGVRVGWRVRADEPLAGWIISGSSALTVAGVAGLLLWLL
jgi:hypothetical protein